MNLAQIYAAMHRGGAAGHNAQSGASAERERVAAIVYSPAAKGREQFANYLAFNSELSAELAIAALKAAPFGPAHLPKNSVNRGVDANRLAGRDESFDRALDREIAKYRPTHLSGETSARVLLERALRANPTDSRDVSFDKALGRELLQRAGPEKARAFLNGVAGEHANGADSAPRSIRVLAAAPRR